MKFTCPNCNNQFKLGKLRASWECPKCRIQLVIQEKWKLTGQVDMSAEMNKYFKMFVRRKKKLRRI